MECLARITGICLTNLKDGSAQVAISSARHLLENGMRTLLSAFKTSYRHPRSALARLMRDRCVERMLSSLAEITDPTRQIRQKRRLSEQDDVSPSNASNGKDSRSKYGKECTNNRSVSKNLSEIRQFFANQLVNNFDFVRRAGKINLNDPSCRSHRKTRLQVIRKEIADRIRIIVDCSYIDSSDHRRILQAHFNFRKSLDSFLHYNDFYGVYNLSGSDLNESMEQLDEALWSATRDQISRTVAIVLSQEILCFLSVGESPTMSCTSHHTQRSTATLHLVPLNSLDEQKFLLHEFRKANRQIRRAFELACECITDSNQLNMIASAKEQITTSESDVATAYTFARTLPGDESMENLQAFLEQWKRIAITCLTGLNNVLSAHVIAKNNTVSASSGSF